MASAQGELALEEPEAYVDGSKLPVGWIEVTLDDVLEILDRFRKPVNTKERQARLANAKSRYPYYGATGQAGEIDDYLLEGQTILLGEDGAPFLDPLKSKAYLVSGKFWVNNHAHVLRAKCDLSNDFFCHQLNTIDYRPFVSGTTRLKLNQGEMKKIVLRVPPLLEQIRIVDRIDELFSRIEAGERAIEEARAGLKRYRKSVLKAAVTGALTEDWRADNPPEETADALLARILRERREAWEATELAKLKAKGKPAPTTDKQWQKFRARYKEPTAPDTSDLPEVPEGWTWVTVETVAEDKPHAIVDGPFGSKLKREHYREEGVRVLRLENIGDGVFVDKKSFIEPAHAETLWRHQIQAGDLAIASLGNILPRVCIVPDKFGTGIVKADCIKFSPRPDIGSEYPSYWLQSSVLRARVATEIRGVGRPRLNLGDIRQFPFPLPPVDEVTEIVSRVEESLSRADAAEQTLEAQARAARALKQSILKAAFTGRLVPQDPNDEPASKLLKRVKEESN